MTEETQNSDWLQVIGKCLAYLCLSSEEGRKATGVLDKVSFLTKLGLPLSDAAALAGSSTASVKELQRQWSSTCDLCRFKSFGAFYPNSAQTREIKI